MLHCKPAPHMRWWGARKRSRPGNVGAAGGRQAKKAHLFRGDISPDKAYRPVGVVAHRAALLRRQLDRSPLDAIELRDGVMDVKGA